MRIRNIVHSKVGAVAAGGAIIALVAAGSAYAATQITSAQIKDGTIQTKDLTKNNFARFTATENVVSATTPVNAAPGLAGARVVEVAGTGETPLVTLVLDKGTWKIDGVAQFWHINGPAPTGTDLGVVTIPGLLDGLRQGLHRGRPRRWHQRRAGRVRRDDPDHRQRHPGRHHGLVHDRQHRRGRRLRAGDAVRLRQAVQERPAGLTVH